MAVQLTIVVEVFELSSPSLSVAEVIHNDCFGDAQGQISVNTSGRKSVIPI